MGITSDGWKGLLVMGAIWLLKEVYSGIKKRGEKNEDDVRIIPRLEERILQLERRNNKNEENIDELEKDIERIVQMEKQNDKNEKKINDLEKEITEMEKSVLKELLQDERNRRKSRT